MIKEIQTIFARIEAHPASQMNSLWKFGRKSQILGQALTNGRNFVLPTLAPNAEVKTIEIYTHVAVGMGALGVKSPLDRMAIPPS